MQRNDLPGVVIFWICITFVSETIYIEVLLKLVDK